MSLQVIMFPGQGSQFEGMGATLFESYPEIVSRTNSILGFDIEKICLQNPNGDLNKTIYTQPALYLVSYLSYLEYLKNNPVPNSVLGHSLGEFTALCAAGVFDFETGLQIVKKRAEFMFTINGTGMAAVIGANYREVNDYLTENFPTIDIANINTSTQIVISGPLDDLLQAVAFFEEEYLTCVPLKVSGGFHSRYMSPLKESFTKVIFEQTLRPPKIPVVANFTARFYPGDKPGIRGNMINQLDGPIRWQQSIQLLHDEGECNFIEVGPGNILSNMIKKMQPLSSERN